MGCFASRCANLSQVSFWAATLAAWLCLSAAWSTLSAAPPRLSSSLDARSQAGQLKGYLAAHPQGERIIPLEKVAEAEAAPESPSLSEMPSLQAFLERMADQAKDQKGADASKSLSIAEGEAAATLSTGSGAEGAGERPGERALRRETIASTELGAGEGLRFPKPERDTENFKDIFFYFPIESGDVEKVGLFRGSLNNTRFTPPQPAGLKSRAVFERIRE